jgi:hypothetical protein
MQRLSPQLALQSLALGYVANNANEATPLDGAKRNFLREFTTIALAAGRFSSPLTIFPECGHDVSFKPS